MGTYKKKKQKGCNSMSRYFRERKLWLLSMEITMGRLMLLFLIIVTSFFSKTKFSKKSSFKMTL